MKIHGKPKKTGHDQPPEDFEHRHRQAKDEWFKDFHKRITEISMLIHGGTDPMSESMILSQYLIVLPATMLTETIKGLAALREAGKFDYLNNYEVTAVLTAISNVVDTLTTQYFVLEGLISNTRKSGSA